MINVEYYQENIISIYGKDRNLDTLSIIRDCFAINRILIEIGDFSRYASFNLSQREAMKNKYIELNSILSKYPDACSQIILDNI